ncbi:unnamed protein product [Sphagnum balticum]
MPKSNNVKEVKRKLTHAERSQIAKDRWAKRRKTVVAQDEDDSVIMTITAPRVHLSEIATLDPKELEHMADEAPAREPIADIFSVSAPSPLPPQEPTAPPPPDYSPAPPPAPLPAEQVAPVAPKKPKRPPVPKEFLVALKTADKRLSDAIEEYEDCQRRIVYLEGAIPRLQRTFLALRNESNPDAPIATAPSPYNFSGSVPNATAFQAPMPTGLPTGIMTRDQIEAANLAKIQAAMNAAQSFPVSKAIGSVQLAPEVIGSFDDNEDEDKFITGDAAGGSGWIGG